MRLSVLCFLCFAFASSVGATPLVSWSQTGLSVGTSGTYTLGYEFTVGPAGARVGALGFFDYQGNGLATAHQVGLWNAAGALLASATVTGGDPLVSVGSQGDGFRFATISTLLLAPGNYVLGAFYSDPSDFYSIQPSGLSVAPGFTISQSLLIFGPSTLTKPNQPVANSGYFGPNLLLVPELSGGTAGTPLAFMALGLLALTGGRRRGAQAL